MIGNQRKGLEKLQKSLNNTSNMLLESQDDISLVEEGNTDMILKELQTIEEQEIKLKADKIRVDDLSSLDLTQALNRLFQFIEVESNISLENLDANY